MQTRHVKRSISLAGLGAVALGAGHIQKADAAIQVDLNGQPLATSVAPVQINQRTMIPMRDIFEALGASVDWSNLTQSVAAHKDLTTVTLQINNRAAEVNGREVLLDQPAILWQGRTMVPLRFVSEALGAQVTWNDALQTVSITAPVSSPNVGLVAVAPLYNPNPPAPVPVYVVPSAPLSAPTPAPVYNPPPVYQAPVYQAPLYPAPNYNNPPIVNPVPAPDLSRNINGERNISVPRNVVVPVTLDQGLSSATAHVGQSFSATVASQRMGDSEFPAGSKLEGVVVEARPRTSDQPGVLDLDFRNVVLPDGTNYPLHGELTSLDTNSVNQTGAGRIVAKNPPAHNNRNRNLVVGAGAGYVVGHLLLKQNGLLSGVLGAAGGYLYDRSNDRNRTADASIKSGTRLGVRLMIRFRMPIRPDMRDIA